MIMDSLLLTVAEMSADGQAKLPVAILPEMRIATGDGVRVDNPETNFQFWLTGNVDYGLCTYRDESLRRTHLLVSSSLYYPATQPGY